MTNSFLVSGLFGKKITIFLPVYKIVLFFSFCCLFVLSHNSVPPLTNVIDEHPHESCCVIDMHESSGAQKCFSYALILSTFKKSRLFIHSKMIHKMMVSFFLHSGLFGTFLYHDFKGYF